MITRKLLSATAVLLGLVVFSGPVAAQDVAGQGIKESPKSLDGVIATIASFEGRKAAYQAVMDIGPGELHVHQGDGNKAIVKGAKHQCFDQAVKLSVNREPIFLIGPTGSGKSVFSSPSTSSLTRLWPSSSSRASLQVRTASLAV